MDKKVNNSADFQAALAKAKSAILSVEPAAETFIFGSRARGDFRADSDLDLLILLPGDADFTRKRALIDALYDVELEFGIVFNVIVYSKDYWSRDKIFHASPFSQNVSKEKIQI